eukprot:gene551-593_t
MCREEITQQSLPEANMEQPLKHSDPFTGMMNHKKLSGVTGGVHHPHPVGTLRCGDYRAPQLPDLFMVVYVFEFGAAVFWGFSKNENEVLLDEIREFATKGMLSEAEFEEVEDDMAFIASADAEAISVANDVITLPVNTVEKQRLAVSYAIAQSNILAIFEARVEKKVEEYKYIPETLAAKGHIHLSNNKIGRMIGEIFVIRHDLNLHSDILDTPDFFWKEEAVEPEYKMVMKYLEMSGRVTVLNTRLDMLRELLDVLQQQMETAHATYLEWISPDSYLLDRNEGMGVSYNRGDVLRPPSCN